MKNDDLHTGSSCILLYIDGSDTCIAAAQYATVLAKALGASIHALYVVDTKVLADLVKARIFVKTEAADYEYDLQQDARRYLSYVQRLTADKGVSCTTEIVTGEVNVQVVNKARSLNPVLLVLNELEPHRSRRETHLDEKQRILRRVDCTVVVVKDEETVANLYAEL